MGSRTRDLPRPASTVGSRFLGFSAAMGGVPAIESSAQAAAPSFHTAACAGLPVSAGSPV